MNMKVCMYICVCVRNMGLEIAGVFGTAAIDLDALQVYAKALQHMCTTHTTDTWSA